MIIEESGNIPDVVVIPPIPISELLAETKAPLPVGGDLGEEAEAAPETLSSRQCEQLSELLSVYLLID